MVGMQALSAAMLIKFMYFTLTQIEIVYFMRLLNVH